MKVLILDGHSPASLAVARSLSRRGLCVNVGAEDGSFFLSRFSRYPKKNFLYPSTAKNISEFLDFFRVLLRKNEYDLIFPVTDRTIVPFHVFRSEFSRFPALVLPTANALEITLDKKRTLDLAKKLGVPFPKTIFPGKLAELKRIYGASEKLGAIIREEVFRSEAEIPRSPRDNHGYRALKSLPRKINFPVVIKSRRSRYIRNNHLVSDLGPLFADCEEELYLNWEQKNQRIPEPIVQEYITGQGYGIFALLRGGEPLALFAHRRLREEDPLGARSSYCESITPPPLMEEYALKLMRELKWTGVAMVEFKLDRKDRIPKLMEINGRFWGSLPLSIACGVDFPYLYYAMLKEEKGECGSVVRNFSKTLSGAEGSSALEEYKMGLKARYLYADIQHLINVFHGSPYHWFRNYPLKSKTLKNFLLAFFSRAKYFNLDLRDPLPGIVENIRFLLKKLL